jgi:hypothetical protein
LDNRLRTSSVLALRKRGVSLSADGWAELVAASAREFGLEAALVVVHAAPPAIAGDLADGLRRACARMLRPANEA